MVRGARGTVHQRLKEGVGESCPGRGHQRLKEGAGEACLASECAPWTEKGREWKGNGGEEARKKYKNTYHQQTEIDQFAFLGPPLLCARARTAPNTADEETP